MCATPSRDNICSSVPHIPFFKLNVFADHCVISSREAFVSIIRFRRYHFLIYGVDLKGWMIKSPCLVISSSNLRIEGPLAWETWKFAPWRRMSNWRSVCEDRHRCQQHSEDEQVEFHIPLCASEDKKKVHLFEYKY